MVNSGLVVFEAEDFGSNTASASHQWVATNAVPGYASIGYVQALPDTGATWEVDWTNGSPSLSYPVTLAASGTFFVWLRGYATGSTNDSVHLGLDGATGGADRLSWTTYGAWTWTNRTDAGTPAAIMATATGDHVVNLWMREDGARVDRFVLTTNASFRPRRGNAWHHPLGSEPGVGFMRAPLQEIYTNTAVTITSGSQYQGGGEAGNQLQSGSAVFYKPATGTVWSSQPMTFRSTSTNNIYYSATIPPNSCAPGDVVQYYLRIPYSDFLPTYLGSSNGVFVETENEAAARANPFSYVVQAAPRAGYASPSDWRDESIYFIFTDRFNDGDPSNNNANPQSAFNATDSRRIHGGDFRGIQQKLDYMKALGATAIWITPIPQNVGGSGYHGYGADNFYQLQPNWGTMADLSNMVASAHQKGIRVVLDVVCNHQGNRIDSANSAWSTTFSAAGYPPRWTSGTTYPAPFTALTNFHNNGHIINFTDPDQVLGELSGLDDLRTETWAVRTNLVNIYKYWIAAADFDGFRLDTVKHVDVGLWQYFNSEIRAFARSIGKTNFFQFGEVYDGNDGTCGRFTGAQAGGSFANDAVVDYPLYFKLNDVLATAAGNTKQIEDRYAAIAGNYDDYAATRLVTFLDNHDRIRFMNSANANNNTNRLTVALGFLYTSRGIPCLYYGTEQNFNGGGDPNNREDMWDGLFEQGPSLGDNFNMTQGTFLQVARLNNFRRLYPSLRRGDHVGLWNDPDSPGLFAYARRVPGEEVFVVFNTASSSQTLPARPTSYAAGTVLVNLLNTNETMTVTAGADGIPAVTVTATSVKMFIAAPLLKPLDPMVRAQSPAHSVSNVPAQNPLTLTFTKPMNTGSVQSAFSVQPSVSGSFGWSAARDVMTFTPSPGFAGSTTVVVRVGTNAVDAVSSNGLWASFETFFVTAPASFTDAVPPSLLVQAPAPDTFLSNAVVVSGTATDNAQVARVEIRVDGGDWVTATGTAAWAYAINSANLLNGSHVLSARAVDSSGNSSAISNLPVRFFNIPGAYVQRLSAGNPAPVTDCTGLVWAADRPYALGGYGYVTGTNGYLANAISNQCAAVQPLYQRERYSSPSGTMRFLFDVPEGIYQTVLLQAETWVTTANARVFDLYVQGQRMLTNYDIFAQAGGMNVPIAIFMTNTVADGQLELHFIPQSDNARVSGIQVTRVGDVDEDGDGIPNWWVRGWFDHPTGQDGDGSRAGDDPDQDGFSNLAEYLSLTSPLDGESYLAIEDIRPLDGTAVSVPSRTGRIYRLEFKADLLGTDDWAAIAADRPGTDDLLTILDTNGIEHGSYRVRVTRP